MGARSKKILTTAKREIEILFTNRALADAEERLGRPIIAVAQTFYEGQVGVIEVATLLLAGMRAAQRDARTGENPATLNDAYDILDEVGFAEVTTVVMTAIAEVLNYNRDQEKN